MSISFRTNSDGSNGAIQLNGTDRIVMTSSGNVTFKNSGTTTFEGTINWPASGVSAGTYGSSNQIPSVTVSADGRVTSASNVPITNSYIGGRGQVFTASGTFTVPDGITSVKVRGCGGGSGGVGGGTTSFGVYCSATGGSTSADGTSSGGDIPDAYTLYAGFYGYGLGGYVGGCFEKYITGLTPGENITVTVGYGGAAGATPYAGLPGICIVEW